jgi:hypothetical protein
MGAVPGGLWGMMTFTPTSIRVMRGRRIERSVRHISIATDLQKVYREKRETEENKRRHTRLSVLI